MRNSKLIIGIFFILTITGQYFIYLEYNNTKPYSSTGKPILYVKITNQDDNYGLSNLIMLNEILLEKYEVKTVKGGSKYDILVDTPGKMREPKINNAINIFYTYEAVMPDIKEYDLVIGFNYIEHPKYIRIPYYYMKYGPMINYSYNRGKCNPKKENYACFLVTGAAKLHPFNNLPYDGNNKRERIFHKLSLYKKVKSGGKYLNNTYNEVSDVKEFMSNCKFVIAYENQSYNGYITEKPFQSYFAGAVPIYFADQSVTEDINTKAVIFASDFKDEEALVEYIKKVDKDDNLYCKVWNEKLLQSPSLDYDVIKDKLRQKINLVLLDYQKKRLECTIKQLIKKIKSIFN